jgi:hypothetical protein
LAASVSPHLFGRIGFAASAIMPQHRRAYGKKFSSAPAALFIRRAGTDKRRPSGGKRP